MKLYLAQIIGLLDDLDRHGFYKLSDSIFKKTVTAQLRMWDQMKWDPMIAYQFAQETFAKKGIDIRNVQNAVAKIKAVPEKDIEFILYALSQIYADDDNIINKSTIQRMVPQNINANDVEFVFNFVFPDKSRMLQEDKKDVTRFQVQDQNAGSKIALDTPQPETQNQSIFDNFKQKYNTSEYICQDQIDISPEMVTEFVNMYNKNKSQLQSYVFDFENVQLKKITFDKLVTMRSALIPDSSDENVIISQGKRSKKIKLGCLVQQMLSKPNSKEIIEYILNNTTSSLVDLTNK
jgi:hypothetical protein